MSWTVRELRAHRGDMEVGFVEGGVSYLARFDRGADSVDVVEALRARLSGKPKPGWGIEVPVEWRGRSGAKLDGAEWLEIVSPQGSRWVLHFFGKLAPWRLIWALEQRKKGAERGEEGKQREESEAQGHALPDGQGGLHGRGEGEGRSGRDRQREGQVTQQRPREIRGGKYLNVRVRPAARVSEEALP